MLGVGEGEAGSGYGKAQIIVINSYGREQSPEHVQFFLLGGMSTYELAGRG